MKAFTDNAGRRWTVAINVAAVKRVKAALGLDLLTVFEGEVVGQLLTDPVLLVDVLFTLCSAEAETRGVTDEQFGAAMAGDAIEHASTAFLEELIDFFPAAKRQVLAKALAKLTAFEAAAVQAAGRRLDGPEVDRQLEALLLPR